MRSWPHRLILWSAYLLTFGVLAYLLWRGWSYYTTPLLERPRHPDYWMLKPGGSLGHGLGVVGAGLMVLMQVYTLRKRLPSDWRSNRPKVFVGQAAELECVNGQRCGLEFESTSVESEQL